ncbi:helix-turn-helix domain-containing protein [Streptomyces sp. NPDC047917]|uniref:helix-turn-helix domain-containing protein n=1 Tax=Streptomyces sp. NPDC047917 TaxID=3365491 RepID=UPI0037192839
MPGPVLWSAPRRAIRGSRRCPTQAVVAGLCGIATDCLSQIERGPRVPSSEVVGRLAAELRVPAGWLLGDDDSPGNGSSRVRRVTV